MNKLPISALVVCHNEAHILESCLKSIQFCAEIVVVDLQSSDNSIKVAEQWSTQVFSHKRVRIADIIVTKFTKKLKYDWILITDPDEQTDEQLKEKVYKLSFTDMQEVGMINAPMQYYFKNKPLKGTIWGGIRHIRYLVNRKHVSFQPYVHHGIKLHKNAKTINIESTQQAIVHHYWMQSYSSLYRKHRRYIMEEGKNKYEYGQRYSRKIHFKSSILAFKESFFSYKGYLDGFIGLFLSFFWAWYVFESWKSLKNYEKEIVANK